MADKDWEARRKVLHGESDDDSSDSNVSSTDHTESRDDTAQPADGDGKGASTADAPDEKTAVQGDGPHGESI